MTNAVWQQHQRSLQRRCPSSDAVRPLTKAAASPMIDDDSWAGKFHTKRIRISQSVEAYLSQDLGTEESTTSLHSVREWGSHER
jgi:hypothetical protein